MLDENEMNEEPNDTVECLGIKAMYFNNIVDRYFAKYYIDQNTDKEQFIFIHTNGVVMCGLGKNNYIVKSGFKINEIKDLNKLTKISGKRKHGAHFLMENEFVLQFMLEGKDTKADIKEFSFAPKVKGKLIEINQNIFANPTIVQESPEKHGFLCFILLNDLKSIDILRERLEKNKTK